MFYSILKHLRIYNSFYLILTIVLIILTIVIGLFTGRIKTIPERINESICNPINKVIELKTNKEISSSASLTENTDIIICSFTYKDSRDSEKEVSFEINAPLLRKNDLSYEYLSIGIPKFKDYINLIKND